MTWKIEPLYVMVGNISQCTLASSDTVSTLIEDDETAVCSMEVQVIDEIVCGPASARRVPLSHSLSRSFDELKCGGGTGIPSFALVPIVSGSFIMMHSGEIDWYCSLV